MRSCASWIAVVLAGTGWLLETSDPMPTDGTDLRRPGAALCAAESGPPAGAHVSPGACAESEVAGRSAEQPAQQPAIDPFGANAACYVCHMTFVREPLSRVHQAEKITCIACHGLSAAHANDENIGATPPDVRYPRERIDASCLKCHEHHNVPARQVVGRFVQRRLPSDTAPVCTDCHGQHRIVAAKTRRAGAERPGKRNEQ